MASASVPPTQPGVESLTPADDAPLTFKIIDDLSKNLGEDWKRFARGTEYFTESQIENIESDERRVYDKCYKMIKAWEQKSVAKVTIAMAKLNVISLGRNDLILDVFNSSSVPAQKMGSTGVQQEYNRNANAFSEPTVCQLRYGHIKKLSMFLDTDLGVGIQNWQQLGNAIFQGDKDASDRIETLHLSYSGGGSPAQGFLDGLKMRCPTFSVNQFLEIAINHERRDISTYIESLNCPPGQQFRTLNFDQQVKIARLLDKNIRGISDWRAFADAVGFSNDEIAHFKLSLKESNQYSPTQSLIELMKKRYPLLNLNKIKMAASSIGRNDVAQYLDSVIDEISSTLNT